MIGQLIRYMLADILRKNEEAFRNLFEPGFFSLSAPHSENGPLA